MYEIDIKRDFRCQFLFRYKLSFTLYEEKNSLKNHGSQLNFSLGKKKSYIPVGFQIYFIYNLLIFYKCKSSAEKMAPINDAHTDYIIGFLFTLLKFSFSC